jgi:hypothetical protein
VIITPVLYVLNISFQNESGVAVEDRVAFACTFLSDTKLQEYLKQLTAKLTEEGDLAGILLTGLHDIRTVSCFGFALEQNFVCALRMCVFVLFPNSAFSNARLW